jgi:hypothetical protein
MSGSAAADTRPSDTRMDTPILTERRVAALQAVFYISTGVWPLVHRHSFERLTGRKAEFWLAQTVGVTVAAIGAGLAHASRGRQVSPELRTVAMTSAAGLMLIDLIFVARRRIPRVYLVDATAEAALIAAWARVWTSRSNQNEQPRGELPVG